MTTKFYYTPGACSLSPHIALREADLPFELVQVDLGEKKLKNGDSFWSVNPKGYVPALVLDSGQLLTEGAIIVQWIADQKPERKLAPKQGSAERLKLQEWLHFIATELHKGFGPVNNPKINDEAKQFFKNRLLSRFEFLARSLEGRKYLVGDDFTVADGYAYYTLRNLRKLDASLLEKWSDLKGYFERIAERPAVRAALSAEGIS
ncbi:MAG TPA: glutathione transferase GstA [Polyangiaceae bacterium]|jgi:glutathione S-transferase|nr:glutathione transferase GstA [Polyangiaceae bacterium]